MHDMCRLQSGPSASSNPDAVAVGFPSATGVGNAKATNTTCSCAVLWLMSAVHKGNCAVLCQTWHVLLLVLSDAAHASLCKAQADREVKPSEADGQPQLGGGLLQ